MEIYLESEERATYALRNLYRKYGYKPYKMSKFEEYDFYVQNKNFLLSDDVITFTDTNGKLLALKPDVTLSIVKNTQEGEGVKKVYYNENVFRVSGESKSFREIMQTGLECIGDVDEYCVGEVLTLAEKSLAVLSDEYVLDVSHVGILAAAVDETGVSAKGKEKLLFLVKEKNAHEVDDVLKEEGADVKKGEKLKKLIRTEGTPEEIVPVLREMFFGSETAEVVEKFARTLSLVPGNRIRVDFSVLNDMRYYNGIVFQGFVAGLPSGVLSGGQYDLLMKKMGKNAGAIGFAVYPERLLKTAAEKVSDADAFVLYDESVSPSEVADVVSGLIKEGKTVLAGKKIPSGRFGKVVSLKRE